MSKAQWHSKDWTNWPRNMGFTVALVDILLRRALPHSAICARIRKHPDAPGALWDCARDLRWKVLEILVASDYSHFFVEVKPRIWDLAAKYPSAQIRAFRRELAKRAGVPHVD